MPCLLSVEDFDPMFARCFGVFYDFTDGLSLYCRVEHLFDLTLCVFTCCVSARQSLAARPSLHHSTSAAASSPGRERVGDTTGKQPRTLVGVAINTIDVMVPSQHGVKQGAP